MSEDFYRDLAGFSDAKDVCDPRHFVSAPEDWVVVLTDVRGSTEAIARGRYKEVNLVGASSITAVLNAVSGVAVPYVFGGDGATLLVPERVLDTVRVALLQVRAMSQREFGLELRIGAIAVRELAARGGVVSVGKYAISPNVSLAMFQGGGLQLAEEILKGPSGAQFLWTGEVELPDADFNGLECRWQPIDSRKGEIISVLVRALAGTQVENAEIYREVIEDIERIAGGKQSLNPATRQSMHVASNPLRFVGEQKVRTTKRPMLARLWYLVKTWVLTLIGSVLMRLRLSADGVDWGRYSDEVIENTDFWKYDDMLRFVIDVTAEQKATLIAGFDRRVAARQMAYGLHSSTKALMTCLVFSRAGNHVHFIDGAEGGYAAAAIQLKEQIKHR